jgi:hypothetical protein
MIFLPFLGKTLRTFYPFPPSLGLFLTLSFLAIVVSLFHKILNKERFFLLIIVMSFIWVTTLLWEIDIAEWAPNYSMERPYELVWCGYSLSFPAYYGYTIPVISLIFMWLFIYLFCNPKTLPSFLSLLIFIISIPIFHKSGPWYSAPIYGGKYPNLTYYYIGIYLVPISFLILLFFNVIIKGRQLK